MLCSFAFLLILPPAESPLRGAEGNARKREIRSLNSLLCRPCADRETEVKSKEEKCPKPGEESRQSESPVQEQERRFPTPGRALPSKAPWWSEEKAKVKVAKGCGGKDGGFQRERVFLKGPLG